MTYTLRAPEHVHVKYAKNTHAYTSAFVNGLAADGKWLSAFEDGAEAPSQACTVSRNNIAGVLKTRDKLNRGL